MSSDNRTLMFFQCPNDIYAHTSTLRDFFRVVRVGININDFGRSRGVYIGNSLDCYLQSGSECDKFVSIDFLHKYNETGDIKTITGNIIAVAHSFSYLKTPFSFSYFNSLFLSRSMQVREDLFKECVFYADSSFPVGWRTLIENVGGILVSPNQSGDEGRQFALINHAKGVPQTVPRITLSWIILSVLTNCVMDIQLSALFIKDPFPERIDDTSGSVALIGVGISSLRRILMSLYALAVYGSITFRFHKDGVSKMVQCCSDDDMQHPQRKKFLQRARQLGVVVDKISKFGLLYDWNRDAIIESTPAVVSKPTSKAPQESVTPLRAIHDSDEEAVTPSFLKRNVKLQPPSIKTVRLPEFPRIRQSNMLSLFGVVDDMPLKQQYLESLKVNPLITTMEDDNDKDEQTQFHNNNTQSVRLPEFNVRWSPRKD
ncbi:hypothetical protein PCE1_004989 [Barthelona sp. PCE]